MPPDTSADTSADTLRVRIAVAGFIALVCAMGIGRFAFTPLLPLMQSDGILNIGGGGLLASVHFLGYAMGALFSGYLKANSRIVLFVLLTAVGAATIAMGLTNNFTAWLVARWLAGVCSALVLVLVSSHFVKRLADTRQSDLQGWVFAGVGGGIFIVGLVTLGLMVASVSSWTGWQLFGAIALLGALAVLLLTEPAAGISKGQGDTNQPDRTPLAWSLLVPYGMMGAGYIIPATYLPIMGKQVFASPLVFGWGWPVFGLAAAVSTLLASGLHARFSNRRIWIASQLIMALGLLVPVLWSHIIAIIIAGICVGGTFMVITMAGIKEAHRITGSHGVQYQIAAMTSAFAIGQMIAPVFAGWTFDATNSFTYPLVLASAALVLSLAPLVGTEQSGPIDSRSDSGKHSG